VVSLTLEQVALQGNLAVLSHILRGCVLQAELGSMLSTRH